jgi:hypothetical protein
MSRALLRRSVDPLPYRLREDVMGYAAFVEEIAPARAADFHIELSPDQRDQVVFVAGILHLRDLVAGQLALAETATGQRGEHAASAGVRGLRIGGEELTRGSGYIARLRTVRTRLNKLLADASIPTASSRLADAIRIVASAE